MEYETWDLILQCWKARPSERPSMEQIRCPLMEQIRCPSLKQMPPSIEQIPPSVEQMEQRVKRMTARAKFRSLITDLNKVYCIALSRHCGTTDNSQSMTPRGSVVSKIAVDPIYELWNLPEHDVNKITASELRTPPDVELFFEFLLDVGIVLFFYFVRN